MQDYRHLIADNITFLRKSVKITQAELAEKLNYSDKAISKWERGESMPDILVLKQLADLFGVPMDFFFENHEPQEIQPEIEASKYRTYQVITFTACAAVLAAAAVIYVIMRLSFPDASWQWKVFISAIPAISLLLLIFNAMWGRYRMLTFAAISALVWSGAATVFVFLKDAFSNMNIAIMFWICVPAQAIIAAWAFLIHWRAKTKKL